MASFTTGTDVEAQPLLLHPAGDLDGQERLRRVVDLAVASERLRHRRAPRTEVGLVVHEQRGAVALRQLVDAHAPIVTTPSAVREVVPGYTLAGMMASSSALPVVAVIVTSAPAPTRRPSPNRWPALGGPPRASASRARFTSVASSSPMGSTRHCV